jgi:iron complex outermembrane receptor protein
MRSRPHDQTATFMQTLRSLIGTLILLALGGQVAAEQHPIEDLTNLSIEQLLNVEVISASRLGQKISQSPSSVSVLTAGDIRTFGWRTLSEALNAMRGLYTSNDRNYSYLGVRGFLHPNDYNSRVLFMIDGQRMNENIYDGGYMAQEFMLDMALVERIEFIPGSGSSIYGANAFSGLINVVTKKGGAINGAQLAGEIGSFNTYKGRGTYGKTLDNGADVLFSASHYGSAGVKNLYFPEFDDPATNNGIAHDMDTERADRLFGRVQFKEFALMGGFINRFKQVPTAAYEGLFNDPDFHTVDQQFFGNLKYNKALSDKTAVRLKAFYQGYDYHADQAYDNGGRVINHDATSGRWWGGEAQLTSTMFEGHRLMLGVEYQYDQRQRQFNHDIDPYVVYQDSNRSGSRAELYAQDDIQILDDLIFSAGLRLDYHHMLKNLQLNPRLGLIWSPLENTVFKLLYSSTFRAPNAWERDYDIFNNVANPDNREERIKSYEGVVEWHSATGLKLTGNLFYNDMTGILEQSIDPGYGAVGPFINRGRYQALGVELEAEKRWASGRLLKASYTFSRVTDEADGGIRAAGSPQNLFKLHYAEPLFNNFAKLGIENIFIDRRITPQNSIADAYNQLNLNLSSDRILPGLDVSIGVYDLLGARYQMLGGTGPADIAQKTIPMNGREFRLKFQLSF